MGLFSKSSSARRRTRRFDLDAAAKGEARGIASIFRSDRLFDVLVAGLVTIFEVFLFTFRIERLDESSFVGVAIVVIAANILFGFYLSLQNKEILRERRSLLLFHLVTVGALALAKPLVALDGPELLFPLGVFAVVLSVAYGQRLATFWTLVMACMVGLMRGLELFATKDKAGFYLAREIGIDFPFALTLATGAVVAVLSLPKVTRRRKVIQAGFFSGIAYVIMIIATRFLLPGHDTLFSVFKEKPGELWQLAFGFLNGLFTGYFMVEFGLRIVEELFDVVTDLRLQELADLNQPILKKFSIEAPGTFHHSQMVGTLAEAAAEAVGANPLLCRVGAHFHDLGKMAKPEYYIENVTGGVTKHEGLTPTMSTLIIVSHVKDGIEMAEELGLPPSVIDCIPEHHGTIAVEYFYHQALKQQQEQGGPPVAKDDFRYPGPKPQSKETGILMIADSVEAISRMLTEPTPSRIEQMVHEVVTRRLGEGQLDECGITLRELTEVERAMCRVLLGIFHGRIKYPKGPVLPAARQPGERGADDTSKRLQVAAELADGPGTPSPAAGGRIGPPAAPRPAEAAPAAAGSASASAGATAPAAAAATAPAAALAGDESE